MQAKHQLPATAISTPASAQRGVTSQGQREVTSQRQRTWRRVLGENTPLYLMLLPAALSILVFSYGPMFGLVTAFQDFDPFKGVLGSTWVGWQNFADIFARASFWSALRNTLIINALKLAIGYPFAVLLALLLNEVRVLWFKRIVQTATMLPFFISWVVAASIFQNVFGVEGIINELLHALGRPTVDFLTTPDTFRWLIVLQDVWKFAGFSAVLYLAAMTTIDPGLYEAGMVDGANRWQRIWSITLPGIRATMITVFILQVGWLIAGGLEQMLVMYNGSVYSTGDILETFSYRLGLADYRYGWATAVALFQAIFSLGLVGSANFLAKQFRQGGIV